MRMSMSLHTESMRTLISTTKIKETVSETKNTDMRSM